MTVRTPPFDSVGSIHDLAGISILLDRLDSTQRPKRSQSATRLHWWKRACQVARRFIFLQWLLTPKDHGIEVEDEEVECTMEGSTSHWELLVCIVTTLLGRWTVAFLSVTQHTELWFSCHTTHSAAVIYCDVENCREMRCRPIKFPAQKCKTK